MEFHENLYEVIYKASEKLEDEAASDKAISNLPEYHIVQTCIPMHIPLEKCHEEGDMFIVVG